ncbi:MAG: asparagine synthase (glutamine-hydrolyzing) [Stappia sp.]|uniref:asparagine synthase (glutamine-hydrolyzing) n=1 Tax=Stappia sp. TaxID=1870903 RepID=UPI000C5539CE|nr:asparagine synthase (glutamine-hydrolyzing) [Stappia sp.]MAA96957.1 asparagine synthase (glutamine-hydrolyzing) [Stappia sp.]MBM19926.1 asparagine synthase (glutamine-hydrolyzing) [Stappia sp.]
MSGIVGWVDFDRELAARGGLLRAMTECLAARGPDGGGIWLSAHAAFGLRRLDHGGPGATGLRPLVLQVPAGEVACLMAGGFDNREELAADLESRGAALPGHPWPPHDDTALALAAFLAFGAEAAERLDGAFALAVWDGPSRTLHLARDRFGVRPLYYHAHEGGLVFASKPAAILANPLFRPRLDPDRLPVALQPRLALPGETPLTGLFEVPPAHVVSLSPRGLTRRRYWRLESRPHRHGFADTAAHVRHLLERAVACQAPGDQPLAAMLSGGIDSTSVAALAAARRDEGTSPLATFCLRFADDDRHFAGSELRPDIDAPFAELAARHMGSDHATLTLGPDDLAAALPLTRAARDLPAWGQFDASMACLFARMRRHARIGLSGEAADEIFGGYPHFFKDEVLARPGFPWAGDGVRLADYLAPDLLARCDPRGQETERCAALLREVPRLESDTPREARLREVLWLGMAGPLSVIIDRKDRMSTAQGIELRMPFLDHHLVEYVWNVPWEMKTQGGVKGLLKAAMADVLPPETLSRRKSAYPHVQHPDYDAALIAAARRLAADGTSPVAALFDRPRLGALVEEIAAGSDARLAGTMLPGGASLPHMLIQLVELDEWVKTCGVEVGTA